VPGRGSFRNVEDSEEKVSRGNQTAECRAIRKLDPAEVIGRKIAANPGKVLKLPEKVGEGAGGKSQKPGRRQSPSVEVFYAENGLSFGNGHDPG
jgi:hypothetical protein